MFANVKKKRVLVPLAVVAALAFTGVALAYWSGTGSGSGTAAVGNGGGVVLNATVTPGIFPGGNVAVGITASNPGASAVQVGTVHLMGVSVDAAHSGCLTSDFSMADIPENNQVPAGAINYSQGGGTLYYADTGIDQNACKGATLTLALTSS